MSRRQLEGGTASRWLGRGGGSRREPKPNLAPSANWKNMRKEIIIGIIGIIAVICFAVFLSWQYDKKFGVAGQIATPTPQPGQNPNAIIILTAGEVAKHNNAGDCWLIVNGKVYNVTTFIPNHSGGSGAIIPFCGKDATTAFDTKNGQGSHSNSAQQILSQFFIGNLGSNATIQQTQPSARPFVGGSGDDINDD